MSSNPVNVALYGHRTQIWAANTTTGSQIVVDRAQMVEPSFTPQSEAEYELGRVGQIGTTLGPPEFRVALEQKMTDSMEFEFLCAGLIPNVTIAQQYNLGQLLNNANALNLYALLRNTSGTILGEQVYGGLSYESIEYSWQVGGASMIRYGFVGRDGRFYTSGSVVHTSWGALDDISFGSIHGKDAVIYFSSGSSPATDKAFRLQSFSIRVQFPSTNVRELGLRSMVGTVNDSPEITVEFETLLADAQPTDVFYNLTGGYYDYQNPRTPFNAFVRVFNPQQAEWGVVTRLFRIENVLPVSHTPLRSQVRGLSTARWTLTMSKEQTADTGGLIVSNRNNL